MSQKIRILLIDDHSLFRESLGRLLETVPDFHVAGSFASVEEARADAARTEADIVLLDYDLGEEYGSLMVEKAKEITPGGRVLLVTAGICDSDTVRMLKIGVSGIFLKHSPSAQLVEAIHKAVRGEIWLDKQAVRALVAEATTEGSRAPRLARPLSDRERGVVQGLFEGLTNKEIAAKLQISENAVKWALQQLFEQTGARVRSQLVRIVLEKYGKDWLVKRHA